jgi:hypothetical protein
VASHHFGERCGVGRAASCCLEDGGHLAEILRAEDAGVMIASIFASTS